VEGIQEYFMVVAQPKDQDDFCVSLRLDTSHLTKSPIMDFERKIQQTDSALANATLPTKQDTYVERKVRWHVSYGPFGTDDIYYKHYTKTVVSNEVYQAPEGYSIESYDNLINSSTGNAFSTVTTSPDRKTLTIQAKAISSIWFQDEGAGACIDNCPPDTLDESPARAERRLKVNLISDAPIKQVGEEEVLMITTRGLCCCSVQPERSTLDEFVVGLKPIPSELSIAKYLDKFNSTSIGRRVSKTDESFTEPDEQMKQQTFNDKPDTKYIIRLANELSNHIKSETIKSLNDPTVELKKYYETDFFAKQLEFRLAQYNKGRQLFNEGIEKDIPRDILPKLEEYFGKKAKEITHRDLLLLKEERLVSLTGLKSADIQKLKLNLMGVRLNPEKPKENSSKKKGNSSTKK